MLTSQLMSVLHILLLVFISSCGSLDVYVDRSGPMTNSTTCGSLSNKCADLNQLVASTMWSPNATNITVRIALSADPYAFPFIYLSSNFQLLKSIAFIGTLSGQCVTLNRSEPVNNNPGIILEANTSMSLNFSNLCFTKWKAPIVFAKTGNLSVFLNSVVIQNFDFSTNPIFYSADTANFMQFYCINSRFVSLSISSSSAILFKNNNPRSRIILLNSNFSDIGASNVQSIFDLNTAASLYIYNCTFVWSIEYSSSSRVRIAKVDLKGDVQVFSSFFINTVSFVSLGGIFYLSSNGNLIITSSQFTGCGCKDFGGIIYSEKNSNLSMENCSFQTTKLSGSSASGGIIYCDSLCRITIQNSRFRDTAAYLSGGVVFAKEGSYVYILNSSFFGSRSSMGSVSLAKNFSIIHIHNSSFENNEALVSGGVLYLDLYSQLYVNGSVFDSNSASGFFGGVFALYLVSFSIQTSLFINCQSYTDGGVMYMRESNGSFISSLILNTRSHQGNGGAITILLSSLIFSNSSCKDSFSKENGGCIYITQSSTGTISNSLFQNNSALNGGTIYTDTDTSCSIFNSNFSLNYADNLGGAIFLSYSIFLYSIEKVLCIQNSALYGGSIYSEGNAHILRSNFWENFAFEEGGALYFLSNMLVLNFSNFYLNTAANGGALEFWGYKLILQNNQFESNYAQGDGGAMLLIFSEEFMESKEVQIESSIFKNNSCKASGGAIFLSNYPNSFSDARIQNCLFFQNTALSKGGALYFVSENSYLMFSNLSFNENKASTGGAVYSKEYPSKITFVKFQHNYALGKSACRTYEGSGGALFVEEYSICSLINSTENVLFNSNSASNYGGAIAFGIVSASCLQNSSFLSANIFSWINNTAKNYGENFASLPDQFRVDGSDEYALFFQDEVQIRFHLEDHFGFYSISDNCPFDYIIKFASVADLIEMEFPLPYTIPIEILNFLPIRFAFTSRNIFPPIFEGLKVILLIKLASTEENVSPMEHLFNLNISICRDGQALEPDDFSFFMCKDCIAGFYLMQNASYSVCATCPPGTFSNGFSTFCGECGPGQYSDTAASYSCLSCSAGRYSSTNGSSSCNGCLKGKFSPTDRAIGCKECPNGSLTFGDSSFSLTQCTCSSGYYGNSWAGESCNRCPEQEGVRCEANSSIPYVSSGWFRDSNNATHVLRCIPTDACVKTEYSINTLCNEGHTGWLCGSCILGEYYKLDKKCSKCGNSVLMWFLLVFLLIMCTLILVKVSDPAAISSIPVDIRITIGWLQMVSLYTKISSDWPVEISWFFRIGSIFVRFIHLILLWLTFLM